MRRRYNHFKKNFGQIIKKIVKPKESEFSFFNLYFEDESRFGLITRNGRSLTSKGVKPVCQYLQSFENLWLFGAFSPVNGEHFLLELPNCNSDNFQIWLNKFSELNPKELKIVVLDNGTFHKAKKLVIPNNIVLVFIPPYCPELNPAEKMWAFFKRNFINLLCKEMDDISKFISSTVNLLNFQMIKNTCKYEYIELAISDYF